MLFSKMVEYCKISAGLFMIDLEDIGLNLERLWLVAQQELEQFGQFIPVVKKFNINSQRGFIYDFTTDPRNTGYISPFNAPTITQAGVAGETYYCYVIAAYDVAGQLVGVTVGGLTQTGNATLTTANYNVLNWSAFGRAVATYSIWRVGVSGESPGLIVSGVTETTYEDKGAAGDGSSPPTTNGEPPLIKCSIVPVGTLNMIPWMAFYASPGGASTYNLGSPSRLVDPRVFITDYRRPVLYIAEIGQFDVFMAYPYSWIETRDVNKTLTEVDIPDMAINALGQNKNKIFLSIMEAKLRMMVGESLTLFLHRELPIQINGEKLAQTGQAMLEAAYKERAERAMWEIVYRA